LPAPDDDPGRVETSLRCISEIHHVDTGPAQEARADARVTGAAVGIEHLDGDRGAFVAGNRMGLIRSSPAPRE